MRIDRGVLDNLERLSMLSLSDVEKEVFLSHVADMVSFVEKVQSLDTSEVSLNVQESGLLREDVVVDSGIADFVLRHAPDTDDGYFVVPKIIE